MDAERPKKSKGVLFAGILALVLSDPDCLKFDYAMAAKDDSEDTKTLADFFKQQAKELGVSDEDLQKARQALDAADAAIVAQS